MKKFTKFILFFLFLFSIPFVLTAQTVDPNAVDGEIYFQLKPGASFKAQGMNGVVSVDAVDAVRPLKKAYRITGVRRPFYKTSDDKLQRTYLLHFKDIRGVDTLLRRLRQNDEVVYAEKAPLFHIFYTPNDPEFNAATSKRWYLTVIKAPSAWDIQRGNAKIKVAVLDNGIDINHPDLRTKIVDKIDLANGDANPTPPDKTEDWSHGTHVSGLVGAATDNGIGIASIGFNVSLMAVKITYDSTNGKSMYFGYQGIVWAADHGADVINMSWGGPGYYQTGQNVVNYAYNKGCVLLAAAGNDGNTDPSYPADYDHVIAVASTNEDDTKSFFSQYGDAVDVCAPGGHNIFGNAGIYSTVYLSNQDYGYMQGTSMSTPIASGLAGLMLSEDSLLTPEKLEAIMKATCDNIDAKNPDYVGKLGAGRINAFKALQAVRDSMAGRTVVADFKASSVSVPEGGSVSFSDLSKGNPVSWKWTFEGGQPAQSSEQNPANIRYDHAGSYKVSLTVSNNNQSNTETKTHFILVYPLITGAWLPQATGFSQKSVGINYISIVNPDVVWANAYDGSGNGKNLLAFTKTVDGGDTWKPGKYNGVPSAYKVSCLTAVDSLEAWVALYSTDAAVGNGGIYATTDGGKSWTHQTSAAFDNKNSFPDIVYFWNDKVGVCMGDPVNNYFEIYTTTDGGKNWIPVPTANIPLALFSGEYGYTNLYAVSDSIIWFGTNKGRVFKSTDRGYHWTVSSTGLSDLSTLGFHNDSIGVASYTSYNQDGSISGFQMVKSTDGGKTWKTVSPSGIYYKSDLAVVPHAPGMLVSTGISQKMSMNGSSYSLDEGNTWTQLDDSIQYTSVKFYNSAVGWAGGFNESATLRGIWKWLGIPTAVKKMVVGENELKIYPNPSTGIVHFFVPKAKKNFELSIFDINGKRVRHVKAMLINSTHLYTLDLGMLKKGLYIAVLQEGKNVSQKKFMIR